MKRGSLILSLVLGICLLATYQPAAAATMKRGKHGIAHWQLPQAELSAAINIPPPTSVHPVAKHLTNSGILPTFISHNIIRRMTSLDFKLTGIHAKNYLLHIYPAMHFW